MVRIEEKIQLTNGPDSPPGGVPLMPGLLVLHRVGVQREAAGVDGRDEPVVERGGSHPVQHGLLDLRGVPGEDQLDLVLGHSVDVLGLAGVETEIFCGQRGNLQQGERAVAVDLVVLVVVSHVTQLVVLTANLEVSVPPSYGGVWIRCGWN